MLVVGLGIQGQLYVFVLDLDLNVIQGLGFSIVWCQKLWGGFYIGLDVCRYGFKFGL